MRKKRNIDPAYDNLRKYILKRDKFKCRLCGRKKCRLNMHHIRRWSDYPSLRYEETNCITLCTKCHYKIRNKEKIYAELLTRIVMEC